MSLRLQDALQVRMELFHDTNRNLKKMKHKTVVAVEDQMLAWNEAISMEKN